MNGIEKAVNQVGGQAALARMLEVKRTTVNAWIRKRNGLPAEKARQIEKLTGVSLKDLRPDLFD